ncbi:hypothetical protein LWI29_024211 [Acer saccharum]|uniref:non-specific serine/threonine protein kinase n=1 Tax=Acer saccharum TaxID=4024 RepID=A0AA39S4U8_ACESA|nr:hypothetical protein LWI29_024211 [Acer saccharum]
MKNSLPFFLFFFFFFFLFFSSFADQSNETSFSFEGFDEDGENFNLEGALIMKPSGVLRLTKRSTNVTGHAFYAESIQMFDKTNTNASSFSTYFVFEIVPLGSDSGGHGLAFVLAPSAELPGAEPGHYLGILNSKNDGWSFSLNGLVAPPLNFTNLPRPPKEKHSTANDPKTIALISALCIVTVLLLCIVGCFLFFRRRRNSETLEDWEINSPHRLRYKDLYAATKGFKESEAIGIGGFGAVYKGVLPNDGREIAVKKITRNSLQGMREFAAEIETLGCMRHKNVLNLLGWCKQKNDLLLVYEYMPNGSLDSLLFNPKNGFVLKWEQRLNIIKGIAAGLLYMHEEWEQVVIHRDVKPSNVLIDAEMNARLGDFGLARLYEPGRVSHTTNVVGTIGYIAPEMTRTGKPSTSSDVYAYGVLLLEMVTGRRPTDAGHWLLVDWVRDCQQLGQALNVIDPLLGSNYAVKEMELVLTLGLICSHHVPEFRPTMRQVMRYLSGHDDLPFVDDWSSADRFQPGSDHENRFLLRLSRDTLQSYPQHWNSLPAGR